MHDAFKGTTLEELSFASLGNFVTSKTQKRKVYFIWFWKKKKSKVKLKQKCTLWLSFI